MKVNQRCRVYGHFLTEASERRGKRSSYKCREFADDFALSLFFFFRVCMLLYIYIFALSLCN